MLPDDMQRITNDAQRTYPPIRAIEFHTKITSKYYGDDYAVG